MRKLVFCLLLLIGWMLSSSMVTTGYGSSRAVWVGPDHDLAKVRGLPPVYFCGESVPLQEERVARRLISALTRNATQTSALYSIRQRASSFFPIIEPLLLQYGIPLDFKYLPLVESALRGTSVSPSGAAGYWQLMPGTARELGLVVGHGRDDRRNLHKSTDAACRYLRHLHDQLGSWTLAAAAYNSGIGNLLSNVRRQQQRNYYFLRLNAETGKYLYRILAFKELFSNYRCYQDYLSEGAIASLSRPLRPGVELAEDQILLSEPFLNEATRAALATPEEQSGGDRPESEIPLPNAADVFRDGIKARLTEAGALQRGQVWVFNLTRNSIADGKPITEGDMLYAIVEDIDPKQGKVFLRAEKLYSLTDKATYNLALAAIDASTGRIGINLPAVDQIKAGWILTWKLL